MTKKTKLNYKEAVARVEQIIAQIEDGEPDVDSLTGLVEEAFELIKKCKLQLRETEEKLSNGSGFDEKEF